MGNIGNGRLVRVCDLCGGVDDHPRHSIAGTLRKNLVTGESERVGDGMFPAPDDDMIGKVIAASPEADRVRLLRDLMDTSSSDRHLDCCAADGCPDGTCGPQVAGSTGTGQKMLDHVMSAKQDRFADRPDVVKGE